MMDGMSDSKAVIPAGSHWLLVVRRLAADVFLLRVLDALRPHSVEECGCKWWDWDAGTGFEPVTFRL
jgi:hypothetical protein